MENGTVPYTMPDLKENSHFLRVGTFVLSLECEEGDEFYYEVAQKELRESPEVKEQAFNEIRLLLQEESNLYVPNDEMFLRKFLRPCKWYANSAFQLMRRYYLYRMNHPRICNSLIPSTEEKFFVSGMLTILPNRTKHGCRVILLECGKKWNPKQIDVHSVIRAMMIALEAAMLEPKTQIAGVHVILDVDGLSLGHVTAFTPSIAATIAEWVQKCVPCRLKGIHVVNQPFIFNMVFTIFKPFILEKTRRRLHFHGTDRASLLAHVDAKVVPTQLGGEFVLPDEPLGRHLWEHFCSFEDAFKASAEYGYTKKTKA